MSDTDTLNRHKSAARAFSRPRTGAGRLDPEVYRRRRGALALAALAAVALLAGIVIGAGAGASPARKVAAVGAGYFAQIRTLAGTGPDSFASTERAAETAAINRTLSYTPYVRVAGSQHREVALTFDDGPGPYTPEVLSALEREHVPATFFEVGVEEQYFHASTAAIVARGYPIGDHTQTHAPMSKLSAKDQASQLLQDTAAIGDYGAPFPRLFRPPYGLWDATTLKAPQALPDADGAVEHRHRRLSGARGDDDRRPALSTAPSPARSSSCTTRAATAPRPSRRCR